MLPDLAVLAVAIPAVVINGLGKGGLGSALGMIGVPLMSLVMSPLQAAAILMPLLLVMDGFAIWGWRHSVHWHTMRIIMVPGLLGIVLGVMIFYRLPDTAIRLMIGIIAVLFCLHHWLSPFMHKFLKESGKPGIISGIFWATVSGFTSFGLHAGGPPMSIYLLPQKLDKKVLAGTTAVFFGIINCAKLLAYGQMGQFTADNLLLTLILLPFCPLSVRLGMKLVNTLPEKTFYQFLYLGLFITGMKLIMDVMV